VLLYDEYKNYIISCYLSKDMRSITLNKLYFIVGVSFNQAVKCKL